MKASNRARSVAESYNGKKLRAQNVRLTFGEEGLDELDSENSSDGRLRFFDSFSLTDAVAQFSCEHNFRYLLQEEL